MHMKYCNQCVGKRFFMLFQLREDRHMDCKLLYKLSLFDLPVFDTAELEMNPPKEFSGPLAGSVVVRSGMSVLFGTWVCLHLRCSAPSVLSRKASRSFFGPHGAPPLTHLPTTRRTEERPYHGGGGSCGSAHDCTASTGGPRPQRLCGESSAVLVEGDEKRVHHWVEWVEVKVCIY